MDFSLHQFVKPVVGILAANRNAGTVNGPAIDRLGYEDALVVVNSGTNGTNGTVDIKVQESQDGSTGWADIPGAAFAQITTDNDENIYVGRVKLTGRKRYIRVVATVGTAACAFGVDVILGKAEHLPVSQVNAVAFAV